MEPSDSNIERGKKILELLSSSSTTNENSIWEIRLLIFQASSEFKFENKQIKYILDMCTSNSRENLTNVCVNNLEEEMRRNVKLGRQRKKRKK